jgi:hypothetical protein
VLPPRSKPEEYLEFCQEAFEAGNEGTLYAALLLCLSQGRPVPDWVGLAVVKRFQGTPGFRRWLKGYRKRLTEFEHTEFVEMARDDSERGAPGDPLIGWERVWPVVSRKLQGTPHAASPRAIQRNYAIFKRLSAQNPYQYVKIDWIRFKSSRP